jgi:tetratricopeptide (TPR) repeat protein
LEFVARMNNLGVTAIDNSEYDQAGLFFRRALEKGSETSHVKNGSNNTSNSMVSGMGQFGSSTLMPPLQSPGRAGTFGGGMLSPTTPSKHFLGLPSFSAIGNTSFSSSSGERSMSSLHTSGNSNPNNHTNASEVSRSLYVYQRGEYDEGMHIYSIPINIDASKTTVHGAIATVLFNLGQLYLRMNENEAASGALFRSLQIAQWSNAQHHHMMQQTSNHTRDSSSSCQGMSNSGSFDSDKCKISNKNKDSCNTTSMSVDPFCGDGMLSASSGNGVSAMAILHNIGHVQYRTGQYEDAVRTYAKALHLGKHMFNRSPLDMLQVAATLNCLGVLYFHLPKAETEKAMELYLESLAIQRAVFGPDFESKEIATTLNNIGRIHYMKGEHDKALDLYQQAMKMRRRLLGDEHLDVAATIYNAGQTHHQRGDLVEAMKLYKEFLIIAKKRLGARHRDVAIMLKCMAQIHHERKEYSDAALLYQEALATGRAALGNYHPEVASTLNKLGNLYYEKGDFDSAISVYKEGLEVERAVLDVFHPNVVVTLTNIGQIHKLRGDYQAALRVYKEAVAIQRHSLGSSHPNIAATLSSIALIHYQSRNFTKSLDVYQEALRIRRDAFGDDNLEVAANLNSIGLVLFKMELHDVAMQSFLESLRIRRNILGPDHRDVAIILYNIATIHLETGDDDEAMEYYRETLRVERISLGANHRDLVLTIQHVGQVHQQRGELMDALKYFNEALEIQKHNIGLNCHLNYMGGDDNNNSADWAAIGQTLNLIGNVQLQRGDASETVSAFADAVRLFRRAGKSDDELAISGFNFYGLSKLHPECSPCA